MSRKYQLAYLTLKVAYLVGKIRENILARLQRCSESEAGFYAAFYSHRFLDRQLKPSGLPLGKIVYCTLRKCSNPI